MKTVGLADALPYKDGSVRFWRGGRLRSGLGAEWEDVEEPVSLE